MDRQVHPRSRLAPASRGHCLKSTQAWRPAQRCSCRIFHLRLRQPEPHVHLAVHRRGGGEVLLGLLVVARPPVQLAEAEVAVGDEGAHASRLGDSQRLAMLPDGRRFRWQISSSRDFTEEPVYPGLGSARFPFNCK
jgi:hypothetical protein